MESDFTTRVTRESSELSGGFIHTFEQRFQLRGEVVLHKNGGTAPWYVQRRMLRRLARSTGAIAEEAAWQTHTALSSILFSQGLDDLKASPAELAFFESMAAVCRPIGLETGDVRPDNIHRALPAGIYAGESWGPGLGVGLELVFSQGSLVVAGVISVAALKSLVAPIGTGALSGVASQLAQAIVRRVLEKYLHEMGLQLNVFGPLILLGDGAARSVKLAKSPSRFGSEWLGCIVSLAVLNTVLLSLAVAFAVIVARHFGVLP